MCKSSEGCKRLQTQLEMLPSQIISIFKNTLSSHYGFKFSSGRVHASLLYNRYHTTAGFKSVSQYNAQQRVAAVKKFSKFSESTFDRLPASGISV